MFTDSSVVYDRIYSFKNYEEETQHIIQKIESIQPSLLQSNASVLDIACGTAEHHRFLKNIFTLDGIDINEEFIRQSRIKNHEGRYEVADMRQFDLGKTYDIILCLFSSIAYITEHEQLIDTLHCFRKHLRKGGIALIEPWMTKDVWKHGLVHMNTVNDDDLKVCRMSQSDTQGDTSVITFHYLIGKEGSVSSFTEEHRLLLHNETYMRSILEQAGFQVDYDPVGLIGRGLYILR